MCVYLYLPGFSNRAPLRAVTAFSEYQPTGLGRWSMENILKPLMGINTPGAFHKLTPLRRAASRQDGCCPISMVKYVFLTGQYYSFTPITHSSQSELQLYKYGSTRSTQRLMRLCEAVVSAGRGAGLLMPLSSCAGLISECLLGEEVCSLTSSLGDSPVWIIFYIPPCWHCS